MVAESRANHRYSEGRVTPAEEIPPRFQKKNTLPGGGVQITDTRLCYNTEFGPNGEVVRHVECVSVYLHADQDGIQSPE